MDIKGSKVHLSKALMNLVLNAVEAMPSGGVVLISTENRYLDAPFKGYEQIPEGEYVLLSVRDEGIGISQEDLKRIFEPFYSKKHMERSGTGLGMTIVWNTIKDHNGFIDIRTEEGEGTAFLLFLPATRERAEKKNMKASVTDYCGSEHLLVVDDVSEQREIARKMLMKLGYRVSCARSGEEAVEFLRKNDVDLVVLDMIMPGGMDGLETYKHILELRPGQKAIVSSGYSESERVKEILRLGAGRYIQKPFTLENIGMAVRTELGNKTLKP